jgi:hypothetical protein
VSKANCIDGIMVRMLALSTVDCGFDPQSCIEYGRLWV